MSENEGEKKSFKVVDRRRFTEEGDERSGPDVAPPVPARKDPAPQAATPQAAVPQGAAPPKPGAAPPPRAEAPKPAADKAPAGKQPPPEAGLPFSVFVQSLAQQCLMQLGLMPWPHGQRELHLEQARDTIDILAMLKTKTAGNLTAEEGQLMDTALYELKMGWVEVQQAIARSKGAPRPPPPPGR
ncbi:MAG: DUF1844 domain-containing protein [Deltaproteobacteria bacterium]|nr:DUF1844 domain-containing protein [Deltaproteobacteria bacterium]